MGRIYLTYLAGLLWRLANVCKALKNAKTLPGAKKYYWTPAERVLYFSSSHRERNMNVSRLWTLGTNPCHCHTPRMFTSRLFWSWWQNFHWLKWGPIKTQAALNRLTICLRVRSQEKTYMTYVHFSSEILTGNLHWGALWHPQGLLVQFSHGLYSSYYETMEQDFPSVSARLWLCLSCHWEFWTTSNFLPE